MYQKDLNVTRDNVESVLPNSFLQNGTLQSFRLKDGSENIANDNRCLMKYDFKQRIDSMFDETRSAILESNDATTRTYFRAAFSECGLDRRYDYIRNTELTEYKDKKRARNTVQARIEQMFADVSSSEIEEDESSRVRLQRFQVDYIGSSAMSGKVTSLEGLQEPLKNLYFNYRKNKHPTSKPHSLLEISSDGLKVHNLLQSEPTMKEQLNPFPSIAVWAALKFVCRPQTAANGKHSFEYAFLPIVVHQKSCEKSCLFRTLDRNDMSCAIEKTYDDHSPLFVVIMRQNGSPGNSLRCHGFACATSEDAIVLAADLYKALATTVSSHPTFDGSFNKKKKVKCGNGLGTVCSTTGSSVCEEQDYSYARGKDTEPVTNKTEILRKIPPSRPPRKNKARCDSEKRPFCESPLQIGLEQDEIVSIGLADPESQPSIGKSRSADDLESIRPREITRNNKYNASICSRRSLSWENNEFGDVLTKVVIPRRGSVLNASGPLASRYNRCANYYTDQINCNRKNLLWDSPLGFIQLFNELRIHEGLNNMDEILNRIIDVDGMSFDSLKPVYKEFIFKLAVTLTKDELYQRSKSIMQKQKRRKRRIVYDRRGAFLSGYRIKRAFRLSVAKLRLSNYKLGFPFTRSFPVVKTIQKTKPQFKTKKKLTRQNATSTCQSNDSFVIGFRRRMKNGAYKNKSSFHKRGEILFDENKSFPLPRVQDASLKPLRVERLSDGENGLLTRIRNTADGRYIREETTEYEYGLDSESSEYKTYEKCYCSMTKTKTKKQPAIDETETAQQSSVSSCSCDTESCIESDKCYCNKKPTVLQQLRRQGFAASESSLSRPGSPVTARRNDHRSMADVKKSKTCLRASKSLEFVHVHKNISRILLNHRQTRLVSGTNDVFIDVLQNQVEKVNGSRFKKRSVKSIKRGRAATGDNKNEILPSTKIRNSLSNDNGTTDTKVNCEFKNSDQHSRDCIRDDEFPNGRHHKHTENNKVLVVSTRDQKGQVRNSFTPLFNRSIFSSSNVPQKHAGKDSILCDTDAMSIKKTAEIAALFSDVKVKYSKDMCNSLNPQQDFFWNEPESVCIKNINLENSLGYFP